RAILRRPMIRAEAAFALLAVHKHVVKRLDMAAGHPYIRVHEDARVQANHIRSALNEVVPPVLLDVALQLNAKGPEIPTAVDAAINGARLKHKPLALAQTYDLVHGFPVLPSAWRFKAIFAMIHAARKG